MIVLHGLIIALLLYYPFPQKTYVTSGFMESRMGRFHAGIDLGTNMQEGVPIISPENGEIYHIHIFNGGYGKAMYMRGNSGKIYVFAHLSRFRSDINKYVLGQQFKTFQYTQNLYFKSRFLVTRNEIIAYTGASGLKSPHLHFEMRSKSNDPINPMPFLNIDDTIPPEIDSVMIVPSDYHSYISGLPIPRIVRNNDSIYIKGKFGIIVFCKDYIDNFKYKTVPYEITLITNKINNIVFKANKFKYQNNRFASWFFYRNRKGWGIRLYKNPDSPNLVSPFCGNVSISASDFAGNTNDFHFFVIESCKNNINLPDSDMIFTNGIIHITGKYRQLNFSGANIIKSIHSKNIYHFLLSPLSDTICIGKDTFYRLTRKKILIKKGKYTISLGRNSLREQVIMHLSLKDDTLLIKFSDTPFEKPLVITNNKYRKKEIFYNALNGAYMGTRKAKIRNSMILSIKLDTLPPEVSSVKKERDTIFVSVKDIDSKIRLNSVSAYYNSIRLLSIPTKRGFKFISNKRLPENGLFSLRCEDILNNKLLYKKQFYR